MNTGSMLRTLICLLIFTPMAWGQSGTILDLGSETLVQAGGMNIDVPGYSIPSFVDWNNDGLGDLVIGEGSGTYTAMVRIYLNEGNESEPQFSSFSYVQSNETDLICSGSGCMGCFPRVVYWDADDRKDLLIGESGGFLKIYLNIGTNEEPTFDGGKYLLAGPAGSKQTIYVGSRPTPSYLDWDGDGRRDIVAGAYDGGFYVFINAGTDTEPDFMSEILVQTEAGDLDIGSRSSPEVLDLDCDGDLDIISGETYGQLMFSRNIGSVESPVFSEWVSVEAGGVTIDLDGSARSRPFVCYWTDDAYPDVLIGAGDGNIHLYQGVPMAGDLNADGFVDMLDFAEFAMYWHQVDCGECGGADLVDDDVVDFQDLATFAANWLGDPCP